jgi:HEPN domain-containing protein
MNEKVVKEWLKYADEDIRGGKLLFENNPEEFRTLVCYHMQQAVEKCLKAYLISNNKEIDKGFLTILSHQKNLYFLLNKY